MSLRPSGSSCVVVTLTCCWLGCATPAPPVPDVPTWELGEETITLDERDHEELDEANEAIDNLQEQALVVADERFDALLDEVVRGIAPPLAEGAPTVRPRVIRNSERNAGVLAGGSVLLSTSLLAAIENEAQLAFLLGHEVAHIVYRHARVESEYEALTASTVDRMKLSRKQEWEADSASLNWVVAAGYSPSSAAGMLYFLDVESSRGQVRAWSSHPDLKARRHAVGKGAEKLEQEGLRLGVQTYEAALAGILPAAIEVELEGGTLARARDAADRLVRLQPELGRAHFLKAQVLRRLHDDGSRAPEVRESYERAVELSPEDPEFLRTLAFLLRELGDPPERSRELFERYLEAKPDAVDRVVIERYIGEPAAGVRTPPR